MMWTSGRSTPMNGVRVDISRLVIRLSLLNRCIILRRFSHCMFTGQLHQSACLKATLNERTIPQNTTIYDFQTLSSFNVRFAFGLITFPRVRHWEGPQATLGSCHDFSLLHKHRSSDSHHCVCVSAYSEWRLFDSISNVWCLRNVEVHRKFNYLPFSLWQFIQLIFGTMALDVCWLNWV